MASAERARRLLPLGVYNQFIFVDPVTRTTIVKLSANPTYGTTPDPGITADDENAALLLHLAAQGFWTRTDPQGQWHRRRRAAMPAARWPISG